MTFHVDIEQDVKIFLNGCLDLSFHWFVITSTFCLVSWMRLLYLKYLRTRLLPSATNGRSTGIQIDSYYTILIIIQNYLKRDDFCYYEQKFKIQKAEWNRYSACVQKAINFHYQWERVHLRTYFYQYTPHSPIQTLYGRPLTLIHPLWKASDLVHDVLFPIVILNDIMICRGLNKQNHMMKLLSC